MPKFFTARENITDTEIKIETEDAKHIRKVLRLAPGDEITVCDGRGIDYAAVIERFEEGAVICSVKSSRVCDAEPSVGITLYQGLPKASKMDYIIQKTTELGIVRIVPVKMARCVVKMENAAAEKKKLERWRKISYEAAKQSGRGCIPEIGDMMTFDEALEDMKKAELCFAPYECEGRTRLRDILEGVSGIKTVSFMIGPEGGYDIGEYEKLRGAGVETVTLGRRILRTETAGEAVLAMTMYGLGEI